MIQEFINKLKGSFSDLKNLSPQRMQELIQDTMKVFQELQEKMASSDPKVKEEAIASAQELKEAFELQAQSLYQAVNLNPDELADFIEDAENFSAEEWSAVGAVKQDLDTFKKQFTPPPSSTPARKKAKTAQHTWLN